MDREQNLKKVHDSELEIAKFFHAFCEKHELKYLMLGGTMLGAVRHLGFIPWDDDMDFGMPRADYEKFIELIKEDTTYSFENFRSTNIKTYFSRLEDKSLNLIDSSAQVTDIRHPWIDIFPIDNVPTNKGVKFNLFKYKLLCQRVMVQYSQFDEIVNLNLPNRPLHESILIKLGFWIKPQRFLNTKKRMEILDKNLRKYEADSANFLVNFTGAYKFREMFPEHVYTSTKLYTFEDAEFYGTEYYDEYLTQLYGEYMKPPKDEHKNKHGVDIE